MTPYRDTTVGSYLGIIHDPRRLFSLRCTKLGSSAQESHLALSTCMPCHVPTLRLGGWFTHPAIQALSFSKDIFGDGSIEMVPPYLLLSEANLGLGLLQSADRFLSMANWSVLKTPNCSNAIRSQVQAWDRRGVCGCNRRPLWRERAGTVTSHLGAVLSSRDRHPSDGHTSA